MQLVTVSFLALTRTGVAMIATALSVIVIVASDTSPAADESLFDQGLHAIESSEYARAKVFLERSLEQQPDQATAYNLAIAYRALGYYVAASRLLRELLDGAYGELRATRRREASRWYDDVKQRIAFITVTSNEPLTSITIDEVAYPVRSESPRFELDPGDKEVVAQAAGGQMKKGVVLRSGESKTVDFEFPRPELQLPDSPLELQDAPRPEAKGRESWLFSTTFWVIASAIVTGGVITYALTRGSESEEPLEPLLGEVETLTPRRPNR